MFGSFQLRAQAAWVSEIRFTVDRTHNQSSDGRPQFDVQLMIEFLHTGLAWRPGLVLTAGVLVAVRANPGSRNQIVSRFCAGRRNGVACNPVQLLREVNLVGKRNGCDCSRSHNKKDRYLP